MGSSTVSASDTYYAVYYSSSQTCFSPVSDALPITFNETPDTGTPVANLTSCNDNSFGTTTFDLDNGLTGEDSGGTWTYQSGPGNPGIGGGNVVNFNNDGSGTYVFRYTLTGTAPCTNQFEEISISVTDCDPCLAGDAAPVLNSGVDTTFCDNITVSLSDYTSSTPPDSNSVLRWSTDSDLENTSAHLSSTEVNATLTLAGTYYAFFWDAANTCASPALVVNVILNDTPIVSNVQAETRCGPGPVTFTATVSGNPTISWYTQMTGGTVAGTGASFIDDLTQTTTYYVEATENGCASSPRIEVTGTVVPQPSAGIPTDTSSCNDPEFGVTTLNLNEQLAGEDPGVWAFTSGPANIAPGTGSIDFIGQPDGIYVFTYTTTGAEAPCEDESASVTVSVSSCDTDDDGDGLFGGTEQALGTDPQNADTDGDGIDDGIEVGDDLENPLDSDVDSDGNPSPDGVIDALDSNILDEDNDGIVDQLDPGNDNPCVPTRENSVCNFDGDDFFDFEEIANGTNPDDPCDPDPLSDACQPIDLEVTKVVDNEFAVVGDRVVFTVTITNLEDRRAGNIIIGDLLETGFDYVSHNASAGTYMVDTGEWQLFELSASSSETLEITVDIIEGGVYTNTAELLSSLPEDSTPDNNVAIVQINIDLPEGINLIVEKTARLGPDKQRKSKLTGLINDVDNEVEVEYFIKVINKSISESVSNIRVQDTFTGPEGAVFEFMEAVVPSGTTFDSVARVWTIESLAVNAEIELSYKVVFRSVGIFVNSAEVIRSAPPESIADDADSKSGVEVEITTRNVIDVGIVFNQFSPNDDGINDDLKINRIRKNADGIDELVEIAYNINIFNRYGNLVFEANDMTEEKVWDGTWKGKEVPEGTYFYVLNIAIENESSKIAKGWIQLIR
ncbi:gliding motility-associated C-terminal domain-containing protein [Maribacter halichondriae]|uniref:T9SS type B sorting domain-containing protein n=1 Tax=Maribacter halichondriae TaxID=2980554 RepID=UPI0023586CC8|nr:gliding motility-associated C-terminal domain-containing protein [Maribacter sp. Hal144]